MSTHKRVEKRYDDIIKLEQDHRLYRGLELPNKMKTLLISNPNGVDRSFVAMSVNIGSMCDPDDLPGLAHFCEHMLSMGSEKYPEQNHLDEYVSRNGGTYNAFTHLNCTTYHFKIIPEKLKGALDHFAQLFVTPLFTETLTEKEINAINSEYEISLADDQWRVDQLEKSSASPDHPFSKFSAGNRETLDIIPKQKGINVRNRLLEFHEKYYSANVMSLLVSSKESLDELENMVTEYFCDVQNKEVEVPVWPEHPFTDEHFRTIWYIVPITDIRQLHILFPLPDMHQFYRSSPDLYVIHLFKHEGKGSLFSALKARGWCNYLESSIRTYTKDHKFLMVAVDLTVEGVKHIKNIVQLTFEYINLLKSKGLIKWFYDQCRDIAKMERYFRSESAEHELLLEKLQIHSINEVMCATESFIEWRPELIEQVMKYLTPQKIRVLAIAKAYESIANETERWYGIKYKKEKISKETMDMWNTSDCSPDLKLPSINTFIERTFDIKPLTDVHNHPIILKDTSFVRLWYKRDDKFYVPGSIIIFNFVMPFAYMDPLSWNLTDIFVQLLRYSLETTYPTKLYGITIDINSSEHGLTLDFELKGSNDKQCLILEEIIDQMINFKIDPKMFEVVKERHIRNLKNFSAEQPGNQALHYLKNMLSGQKWLNNELLKSTAYLSVDRLQRFIQKLFSRVHVECLIYGNVTAEEATDMVELVESKLKTGMVHIAPLLQKQLVLCREIKLEDGCQFLFEAENKFHKSSCTMVYYATGLQSIETNVLLDLLVRIIQEPCYNTLRNNEQLGYEVESYVKKMNVVPGLVILVQGDKHPKYVKKRIDLFLDSVLDHISTMPEEKIEEYKNAGIHEYKTLRFSQTTRLKSSPFERQCLVYIQEILDQEYNFNRVEDNVNCLQQITRQQLINFYKKYIHSKCTRRKLSIHVTPTSMMAAKNLLDETTRKYADWSSDEGIKTINDISLFKKSQALYPALKPITKSFLRKGIHSFKL